MRLARDLLLAAAIVGLSGEGARATEITVPAGDGLVEAIAHAVPGDVLHLAAGRHRGPVTIATPRLTLEGAEGAVTDGDRQGNTITITAPDVVLRGLTIRGSGLTLIDKNSAVFVAPGADRAVIEDNRFEDNLIGIYLDGPHDVLVRHNWIEGLHALRRNERGPGVALWNAPGSKIIDNDFRAGRDGVFSVTSGQNSVQGNRFHELRFAVHFMYTNNSVVKDNISIGNDIGYAMMYSDRLDLSGNISDGDRDHALLFNYANEARIVGNVARGSDQCVFIFNANKNRFTDNWFEGCETGIHFTAGSERNVISGNAFVSNRAQVKYVGTRTLDWAEGGRGNYWSDNPAFDLTGRGIADAAYRPNDVVDQVVWRAPWAKLLLNSPAVQVLRWAQAAFPAIHPGGVYDSAPLMQPPHPPALARLETGPGTGR
jgi:nitrous oxidase accessory protein